MGEERKLKIVRNKDGFTIHSWGDATPIEFGRTSQTSESLFKKKDSLMTWMIRQFAIDKDDLKVRLDKLMPYGFKGEVWFEISHQEYDYRETLLKESDEIKKMKLLSDKLRYRSENVLVQKLMKLELDIIINKGRTYFIENPVETITKTNGVTGLTETSTIHSGITKYRDNCTKFVLKKFINDLRVDSKIALMSLESEYHKHFKDLLTLWEDQKKAIPRESNGLMKHEIVKHDYQLLLNKANKEIVRLKSELQSQKHTNKMCSIANSELRMKLLAFVPNVPIAKEVVSIPKQNEERRRKVKEQRERMAKNKSYY